MNETEVRVFLTYTDRFDRIMETFPVEVRTQPPEELTRLDLNQQERRPAWVSAVVRYFNLCSEEHFLHEQGVVSDALFAEWAEGMRAMAKIPLVRATWDRMSDQYRAPFVDFWNALE